MPGPGNGVHSESDEIIGGSENPMDTQNEIAAAPTTTVDEIIAATVRAIQLNNSDSWIESEKQ